MKTTIKVALAALTIASLAFSGCKKGEGDPFLSLKTRKGRIHGEWTVKSGEGKDVNGSITSTWTYDGTKKTTTVGSITSDNKFTETYEFEKDGAFTYKHVDNNGSPAVTETWTGTWNWTGGVGDMKNKSQIVLTVLSYNDGSSTVTYTGSDAPHSVMDVYELKSKEMIFKGTGTTVNGSSSTSSEFSWTLEKN